MAFESYNVIGTKLVKGFKTWPLASAEATVDIGSPSKRITATRLVALGVFALAAKKNTSKIYVSVTLPDGDAVVIETSAKNEKQAREFAAKINKAAHAPA